MADLQWLTEKLAIQHLNQLGLPAGPTYLRDLRRKGEGPPHKYFGAHLLFHVIQLDAWVVDVALKDKTWSRAPKSGQCRSPGGGAPRAEELKRKRRTAPRPLNSDAAEDQPSTE
jgi:hypothetical protein